MFQFRNRFSSFHLLVFFCVYVYSRKKRDLKNDEFLRIISSCSTFVYKIFFAVIFADFELLTLKWDVAVAWWETLNFPTSETEAGNLFNESINHFVSLRTWRNSEKRRSIEEIRKKNVEKNSFEISLNFREHWNFMSESLKLEILNSFSSKFVKFSEIRVKFFEEIFPWALTKYLVII